MNLKTELWSRVKKDCAAEIAAVRAAVDDWNSTNATLTAKCFLPGQAKAMIETLERTHGSEAPTAHIDRMELHVTTTAYLKTIVESQAVQNNAVRQLNTRFMALEPLFAALENAADKSLNAILADVRQREEEFFAGFGLRSEETSASKTVIEAKARIRGHGYKHALQAILNSPAGHIVPTPNLTPLHFLFDGVAAQPLFGVQPAED